LEGGVKRGRSLVKQICRQVVLVRRAAGEEEIC